jgi:hypothetical protein
VEAVPDPAYDAGRAGAVVAVTEVHPQRGSVDGDDDAARASERTGGDPVEAHLEDGASGLVEDQGEASAGDLDPVGREGARGSGPARHACPPGEG